MNSLFWDSVGENQDPEIKVFRSLLTWFRQKCIIDTFQLQLDILFGDLTLNYSEPKVNPIDLQPTTMKWFSKTSTKSQIVENMFPRVHWRGWANSKAAALPATCSLQVTAFISDSRVGQLLAYWLKICTLQVIKPVGKLLWVDKNLCQPSLVMTIQSAEGVPKSKTQRSKFCQ